MEYAIVEIKGKQFMIKPGDKVVVDGVMDDKQLASELSVLLVKDKSLEIGTPTLKTKLNFKVLEVKKSKKILVEKFRAKSRYRRRQGHRQDQTILEWVKATSIKKPATAKMPAVKADAKKKATPTKTEKPEAKSKEKKSK